MPFSNQVIITMKPLENFSSPPGEFRDKMTGELKIFLRRKLAPDIWANLERSLKESLLQKLNSCSSCGTTAMEIFRGLGVSVID